MTTFTTPIQLSSKRLSNSKYPFIWSIGTSLAFYKSLPANMKQMQILNTPENGLCIKFSGKGNKLSKNGKSARAAISRFNLFNVSVPQHRLIGINFDALYDTETGIATLNPNNKMQLPDILIDAMKFNSETDEHPTINAESAAQISMLRRRKRISNKEHKTIEVASLPVAKKIVVQNNQAVMSDTVIPPSVLIWDKTNLKNLSRLIAQVQLECSDIVFISEEGVVKIKRSVLEEI